MGIPRPTRGLLFGIGLALLVPSGPLVAQVEDSTAIRVRDRLRILNLPPGDSSQAIPRDSLPEPEAPPTAADSAAADERPSDIIAALRALSGYTIAEYRGTSAEYRATDGLLYLYGDSATQAMLLQAQDQLRADSMIVLDEERGQVDAMGSPVFQPAQGDEIVSERLRWNFNTEEGQAIQARTNYQEGATWIVTGDLPLIRTDVSYGHETRFTSCEEDEPHYHFQADELKIVGGSILVARGVRLYFGDVPVFWLPFVAQSLQTGRSSGLLTPSFSINDIVRTSGGYRRRISNVGFYWAMSDYMDSYVALDWFDDTYTAVTGGFQYRWLRQFLQGSLNYRHFFGADGVVRQTLSTRHSWEMSERTSFSLSANYASDGGFVRRNSFDPQEVTRSIDSQGGFTHRFDWGQITLNGNRRQYLSDDRVEMTLPSLNLSLNTMTLLQASPNQASWYNNMSLGGSGRLRRSIRDYSETDSTRNDEATLDGQLSSSLQVGNLSLSGSVSYQEHQEKGVLRDSLSYYPGYILGEGMRAFHSMEGRRAFQEMTGAGDRLDVTDAALDWSASLGYTQNLIGSTTLTPNVTLSRSAVRADTAFYAQSFVSAPMRVSVGASLRSDLYGFYPGVAGFERIRHKVSPSFTYDYAPEVQPTDLQREVFGSTGAGAVRVISVGLNQTFEAKRPAPEEGVSEPGALETDSLAPVADSAAAEEPAAQARPRGTPDDGLRRLETGEVVQLLGLSMNAVSYDLVRGDSLGFLQGFQTTRLNTTITSDYLRGLSISVQHDLFDDQVSGTGSGDGAGAPERRFAPHLAGLNFGFSLSNRSAIVRWLGLGGGSSQAPQPQGPQEPAGGQEDFGPNVADEASIVPRMSGSRTGLGSRGSAGGWSANLTYALNRPREGRGVTTQTIQGTMSLQPTEKWEMRWRTGYDVERREFLDHNIQLVRDLHRWQATFGFQQTASGNWRFNFNVSLLDNRDLKFDYRQTSLDTGARSRSDGG